MLRGLAAFSIVCFSVLGALEMDRRSSDTPLAMTASSLEAIRAGATCSFPTETSPTCTVCTDLGGGLYGKCNMAPDTSVCASAGGPCFTCSDGLETCPGWYYTYTIEGCPDGNGTLINMCDRKYSQPTVSGCQGYCS